MYHLLHSLTSTWDVRSIQYYSKDSTEWDVLSVIHPMIFDKNTYTLRTCGEGRRVMDLIVAGQRTSICLNRVSRKDLSRTAAAW